MPLRCSQSSPTASCRRSFRVEPRGSRLARRSASAACSSSGERARSIPIFSISLSSRPNSLVVISARRRIRRGQSRFQARDRMRQVLQCVGQINTGSLVQTLNQTSDFRRHGKLHVAMPVLLLSPTSRVQSSGASWMGNHCPDVERPNALGRASRECRDAPLEAFYLLEGTLALGSLREPPGGLPKASQ